MCWRKVDPLIGRDDEVNRTVQILCRRRKNNPLLVGEAGVGKTAIAEDWLPDWPGDVPEVIANSVIYSLDMGSLLYLAQAAACLKSCSPPATLPKLYRTFLNIMDGKKPSVQIIDVNGNGIYNSTDDSGASRMTASVKESKVSSRSKEIRTGSDGVVDQFNKLPEQPLRPSWRQLR